MAIAEEHHSLVLRRKTFLALSILRRVKQEHRENKVRADEFYARMLKWKSMRALFLYTSRRKEKKEELLEIRKELLKRNAIRVSFFLILFSFLFSFQASSSLA